LRNVAGAEVRQFRRPGILLRRAWVDALNFAAALPARRRPEKRLAAGHSRHGDRPVDHQTCANIAVNGWWVKDTAELHEGVAAVR
jgi:hypothetical protein